MKRSSPRTKGKPARKATSTAARRPAASKAKRPARRPVLHRLNPASPEELEGVWKAWTGTAPGKTLRLDIQREAITPRGRVLLPKETVMLGRVSKLFLENGKVEDFGGRGPLMVTDAEMRRLWLVDAKPRHFDHQVALIGYLARKPKFGDREPVEYIHEFDSPTQAVMAGQVGAIKGRFRLTERGIEG